ncbi:hypothetical protein MAL03_19960 (plasmid) [Leptospira noguchii]|uniref:Uncharacterized protein n=1 Tax=Leptospira noguchii TaxID=28182 RepID=A0AAE9GF11_9LEPT|nr:hypothetical protein [Leptospira noguchii]UOG58894.1 hypothetical protein MAL03_19960 [Leptospira noguchii]
MHEARGMLSPSRILATNQLTAKHSKRVSYNRQDGLGTSAGISSNNNKITHGMGLNITRSEYGGWGADVSSDNYGPGNLSGGLAYTQRDGFTVSLNVNGTNAFNYNSQSGLSSNTDFMSQYAMNNGLAQGVAEDTDTSDPNSAQQHNNAEQGAQVIEGAGVSTTRREGEGGDAVDQRIAQLKKELSEGISLADGNGTMSDAGNPALASAAKELSSKMAELQKLESNKAARSNGESASDRHLKTGEDAISNHLDKQRSEKPYLQKGEVDVSAHPDYHKKLINMELEGGVSGGNLIRNEKTGKLYYRTEGLGADHTLIPTNPNERVKSPWTQTELHTDGSNGIYSGDYHAPKGSAQSVWGPAGGTFEITRIKTMELGGNEITTRTVINGKEIIEHHRHVMNQMPDVAYNAFKKGTSLPYGTPIGYTGITGNMAVSINNDKNSPRFGMLSAPAYHMHTKVDNAETHTGFIKGVTFGPEVRQSQGLPAFDYAGYYKKKALDLLTGGN